MSVCMKQSLPTDYQRQIVFGYVIGDGYLYENGRLQIDQEIEQRNFVYWLYNKLENLASGEIKTVKRIHPKTKKESFSCRFYTKKMFKELSSLFYNSNEKGKRKKVVPKYLEEFLDPIALAVWFMCDGTKYQSAPKGVYINASSFSKLEQSQIQQSFSSVFGLTVNIHEAGFSQTGRQQFNFFIPV